MWQQEYMQLITKRDVINDVIYDVIKPLIFNISTAHAQLIHIFHAITIFTFKQHFQHV